MNTEYAPLNAVDLVASLAGEHLTMPEIIVEIIKEDDYLMSVVSEYRRGRIGYEVLSAKVGEYL